MESVRQNPCMSFSLEIHWINEAVNIKATSTFFTFFKFGGGGIGEVKSSRPDFSFHKLNFSIITILYQCSVTQINFPLWQRKIVMFRFNKIPAWLVRSAGDFVMCRNIYQSGFVPTH